MLRQRNISTHFPPKCSKKFLTAEQVIQNGKDIVSNQVAVQHAFNRILVGDTDNGKKLKENIADLKELIEAYRQGIISEREK